MTLSSRQCIGFLVSLLIYSSCLLLAVESRRLPKMHAENPNIRHVPRGPPPPHPGRLDKNPPPSEKHLEPESGDTLPSDIAELNYEKYLREVTRILESDPEFKKKMHNATREDVITGKLAKELDFSSHHIRTQLDEAKRREIERLRTDLKELDRLRKDDMPVHKDYIKAMTAHMARPTDPKDVNKFTAVDLQALIDAAQRDLDELDRKRREEFKKHEIEREIQRRREMEKLTPEDKAQSEREYRAQQEALRKHPKMHEPGHKANLEEVWEEQDHMDKESFNPRTFFVMHDMNSDEFLDERELEALFVKESEKMYLEAAKSGMEKNELERLKEEEMSRMREHVMREIDSNKDRRVSYEEFDKFVNTDQYKTDQEWKGVGEEDQFSEGDLKEYEKLVEEQEKLLEQRKRALKEYKERMKSKEGVTKPPGQQQQGGVNKPPHAESYYDVDGERLPNFDARIEDYDDYSQPQFEEF